MSNSDGPVHRDATSIGRVIAADLIGMLRRITSWPFSRSADGLVDLERSLPRRGRSGSAGLPSASGASRAWRHGSDRWRAGALARWRAGELASGRTRGRARATGSTRRFRMRPRGRPNIRPTGERPGARGCCPFIGLVKRSTDIRPRVVASVDAFGRGRQVSSGPKHRQVSSTPVEAEASSCPVSRETTPAGPLARPVRGRHVLPSEDEWLAVARERPD